MPSSGRSSSRRAESGPNCAAWANRSPSDKEGGPVAGGWVAHHDEAPGLAVADRRGHVGGRQDASQDVIGHRLRTEPANIASGAQHGVECLTLRDGKRPRLRVALSVHGRGGIADEGNRA